MRSVRYVCLFVLLSWSLAAAEAPRRYVSHTARVPNEYIVTLSGIPIPQADAVARVLGAEYGLTIVYVYKHAFAGFHCKGPIAAAQRLAGDARVQWVEENSIHYPAAEFFGSKVTAPWSAQPPNPPFEPGWTLRRISQRLMIPANERGNAGMYGYASGGEGVRAYIVDSAVLPSHLDFGSRVEPGYDAIGKLENETAIVPCGESGPDAAECSSTQTAQCVNGGHGTAVASILGGKVFGVAPGVMIVPVRIMICNSNYGFITADLINGLDWIAGDLRNRVPSKGAVINMSFEGVEPAHYPAIRASLAAIVQAGGVFFAAAGNNPSKDGSANSGDACLNSPARFAYGNGEGPPHVITVSGTEIAGDTRYAPCPTPSDTVCRNEQITEFSYGKCVDIFAPGVHVRSAAIRSSTGARVYDGERRTSREGTSFATPHVAGVAARLLAELNLYNRFFPGLTSDRVWNALRETATPNIVNVGTKDDGSPADTDTTRRMVYIGGVTITAQPYIASNIAASGSTPAKARLRVEANPRGATLNYTWYQGNYSDRQLKQSGPDAFYDAARDIAADYWVRIEGTYTIDGASRTLTTDSAILPVTRCLAPQQERPRIDILQGSPGKRLLQASVAGSSYKWYSGPYTDPRLVAETSTSSHEVSPDVITPYWVRIVLGSDCTLDSAIVDVPAVCPLSSDILLTKPTRNFAGTELVRMAEEGTNEPVPQIRVPLGGNVALTMKTGSGFFSGRVDDARWVRGSGESRVEVAKGKIYYYRNVTPVGTQPLAAVVKVEACETARRVDIGIVNKPRLYSSSVLPANPVYKRDVYKKKTTCTTDPSSCPPDIKIRVNYSAEVQRVEWRRSAHDDSVRPLCAVGPSCSENDIQAKIETHPPTTATGTGYTEITIVSADSQIATVGPGQYWVRLLTAGTSEDGGLIEDSDTTTVLCEDCKSINRRRGLIKVGGQAKTHIYKASPTDFVTLDVPEHVSGQTYEWRKGEYDDTKPIEETQPSWHTDAVGDVWVRTKIGETATDSYLLTIEPQPATPVYVTVNVTPSSRAIGLERDALIEATATGFCNSNVDFIWYSHNPDSFLNPEDAKPYEIDYGPEYPVLQPTSDVTVWVKATSDTCSQSSAAVEVTIIVLCEPVAHVTAITNPLDRHVAKNELVSLAGVGYGKEMVYSWFQGLEGNDNSSTLIAHGPGALRQPTTDITYWVRAQDSCGNVDTDAVTLYVCKPTINAPLPETLVITAGHSESVTVDASPAQPGQDLSYQWHTGHPSLGGTPIPGQITNTLLVSQAGEYFVTVRGSCPDTFKPPVNSTVVRVSVCNPPVINSVSSTSIASGQTAVISVTATGSNLTYQWYRGQSGDPSQLLQGETFAALSASPSATTNYWCRVRSDGSCSTDSATATISVCTNPVITEAPEDVTIGRNNVAELGVVATGATGYQWYDAATGNPITGATDAYYVTPPLTQDKRYFVRVVKGECHTDSAPVTVYVCELSVAVATNKTQIVSGESALITAAVTFQRGQELYYTWYSGPTATDTTQLVTQGPGISSILRSPSTTTWYRVNVSDGTCVVDSNAVKVEYCVAPTVNVHPVSQILDKTQNPNASTTLQVAATGDNRTYQWYIGQKGITSSPISGATSTSLTVSPNQTTTYWARVSGSCGVPADTDAATVTVCVPASISGTSGPHFIRSSQSAQLSVTASGANLTYQWYAGTSPNTNAPVAGGNGVYATVSPSATTTYWVQVKSDGACATNSANVTVDVCTDPSIGTQPASQTINSGANATMSVVATSTTGTMTYQWYRGVSGNTTQPIAGATGASYSATALTADSQFWVRVTRGACWKDSNTATITVCSLSASVSGTLKTTSGQQATITAMVYSSRVTSPTITFYRGAAGDLSTPLQSSASTQLNVYPTSTTTYWARVNDGTCTTNTTAHTVDVCIPAISVHPSGGTVSSGGAITLGVTAGGTSPITYQWYRGNTGDISQPVSGAVQASATVYPTATSNYWVRVNGSCNVPADSNAATVTVCAPPSVGSTSGPHYIRSGQSAQMSVSASGNSLTYQWYSGTSGNTGSPVTNGNAAVTTVSPTSTTTYWAQVKSYAVCAANSGNVTVDVCTDPTISSHPTPRQIRVNETTTLTVSASSSSGPVTYQWYRGASGDTSQLITGATSSSYTTPALTADTSYWVRVSRGPACSKDSTSAMVTVCSISASVSGTSQTTSGQAAALTATVYYSRVASPTITWYRGATGDTSNVLQSSASTQLTVYPTSTTSYWARVTDGTCPIDTTAHTVNVCIPTISAHPVGATVAANTPVSLTVTAGGTSPLTYQWYKGNPGDVSQPVGGNSSSVTVSTPSTANYWCRVSGSCGIPANSNAATITICTPPSFFANSGPHMIQSGQSLTLSSSFNGTDVTYQWYQGTSGSGSPIGGATTSPYLSVAPTSTTSYWAQARSGGACPANSPTINVDVCTTPSITSQPASATVATNSTHTMTVTASTSPGTVTYQWYLGTSGDTSQPINGATGASYTTPPMTSQTQYWVRVTRGACYVNSATATVSVCVPPYVWLSTFDWGECWGLEVKPVAGGYNSSWRYHWYKGPVGNVSASVDYGESGFSRNNICPTATETWWVRVSYYENPGCYKDVSATIYPR